VVDGMPFISFKSNTLEPAEAGVRARSTTSSCTGERHSCIHYHKRSKIETTYSMVKSLRQEAGELFAPGDSPND
jgi:hypothetical protein